MIIASEFYHDLGHAPFYDLMYTQLQETLNTDQDRR